MQNLKITIDLSTPVLLNRLTTIDSILLATWYKEKARVGKPVKEIDETHSSVEWIHREKGVLSGSIWYVDKDAYVDFDFQAIVKNPELKRMFDETKRKGGTPEFKQAFLNNEFMLIDSVYFYINAKPEVVNALLSKITNIGALAKLDYGKVKDFTIEVIEEDKSFMLNSTTPSKPLPVSDFSIKSKKIAFFRKNPPYWLKHGKEACYMPTSSLYEAKDNSLNKNFSVAEDICYISNVEFLYKQAHSLKTDISFVERDFVSFTKTTLKKYPMTIENNNVDSRCIISGDISKEGYRGRVYHHLTKGDRKGFGDLKYIGESDFLSKAASWCLDNASSIGYSLVSNDEWRYLQGKNAPTKKEVAELLNNIENKLIPPFSINLKDTINAQHISFKNTVSLSNAWFYFQYGDSSLQIDGELLIEAISDIRKIGKENKDITKTHLCRKFNGFDEVVLKRDIKDAEAALDTIQEFQKKYDKNIRHLLSVSSI